MAVLCILCDSSCGTPGVTAPPRETCGTCGSVFANHLQKGRHEKKYRGSCRHLLLSSATDQLNGQRTELTSGHEEAMLSSGTHCSWEQHEEASGSQPGFDQGANSGSDNSSDTTSSEDTTALGALDPLLDATFELAIFMRRACLPRSMVQELLDLVHNPNFDWADVRFSHLTIIAHM